MRKTLLNAVGLLIILSAGPIMAQTISQYSPATVAAGGNAFLLTVNGTNLATANLLSWTDPSAAAAVGIPFVASGQNNQFQVTIPAARIANSGFAAVAACVNTLASCGPPVTFPIRVRPTLTGLSQTSAIAGSGAFSLTLTGSNFTALDAVTFIGGSQNPAVVGGGGTTLTATISAGSIANPGNYAISSVDTAAGAHSNSLNFTVGIQLLAPLSPNSTLAGSGQPVNTTVNAVGGLASASFLWNGSVPLAVITSSATSALIQIPAALINPAGTGIVTASLNGQTSNGLPFTALGPATTSLFPTSVTAGSGSFTLTVNGSNFGLPAFGNALVTFTSGQGSSTILPITNTGGQLTATIPGNLVSAAGPATVVVQNFAATGGPASSPPLGFTIFALPVVSSVSPVTIPFNTATPITVSGAFNQGDQIVFNGTTLSTTGNTTTLQATVPANQVTVLGPATVRAINPIGSVSSTSAAINVIPVITSLSPTHATAGSGSFPLTVNVTGGLVSGPSATISFNGTPIIATPSNATQATVTIPAALIAAPGQVPVTISTAGATSAPVSFSIDSPSPPVVSQVTPNAATAGDGATPVLITGTNFKLDASGYTGARVVFTPPVGNPVPLTPTSNTGTSIAVTIPQAQLAQPGSASIVVWNVSDGQTSGSLAFSIRPRPAISSLTPNPVGAGSSVTLVVQGANFTNGDTILIGAPGCNTPGCLQPLSTSFNSATNLGGALLGALIPLQGTYSIYVQNSLGALSGAAPLTVSLSILQLNLAIVTQNVTPPPTLVVISAGGFVPGAVVLLSNQALTTVYDSPTQVHAVLTAANVAVAGVYSVAVQNPNSPVSNSLTFTVLARGQITSVNPPSAFAGSGEITIQVNGANFQTTDVVRLSGSGLSTTFVNSQTLTATVPAALLTNATTYVVTVFNGLGDSSNGLNFPVTLQITSLSPASVTAGGAAFNLTANLTGGVTQNTVLNYAGTVLSTVSFTATSITAAVPASLITAAATPAVFAMDGANQSNIVNHLVLGPLTLISIAPTFVDAGTNGLTLSLTGVGFDTGTFVTVNGASIQTTVASGTSLTAQVPASMLVNPQTAQVSVTDSRNRTSNQLPLGILTPLTLTSLSPYFAQAGSAQFTVTASGTGFDTSTSLVWTNGSNVVNLTTAFVSATQLTALVPASLVAVAGSASVQAIDNRQRGSNSLPFTIANPLILSGLNPASALTGTAVNLVLTGSGFTPVLPPGAGLPAPPQVQFGPTTITGQPISDTQINVTIPAAANSAPGSVVVSVRIADGRVSNGLSFGSNTNPMITGISPVSVDLRASGLTLTVDGLYFQPGAVIVLNGTPLTTTFVSTTRLTGPLPPFTAAGTTLVVVVNPTGLQSNAVGFTIGGNQGRPPGLSAITPQTVATGSPAFTLAAVGGGFQSGSAIIFGGTALSTTYISPVQLTGSVSASLLTLPGNVAVSVSNPDGTSSNALIFVISSKPIISSLSPPSVSAGAASFGLGVSGSGFKTGASVSFGGAGLSTTFVNASQLTASVPASLVAAAGQIPVTVTNPDGYSSDPVNFTVTPFALTSISPAAANAGGNSFSMTLTGTGFLRGASASFNGSGLTTNFVSANTLTASVPASLIAMPGTARVTVTNPDGAVGGPLSFAIRNGITLSSISPTTIPANSKPTPISATGTGFVQGASIVINGNSIGTTFGGPTSLSGTIPAELLTQQGTLSVSVVNPNGDASNGLTLTVGPALPPPVINSLSPATAFAGAAAATITVNGSGFVQGSAVVFGGAGTATTFVSATQLRAVVSAAQLSQGGLFTVVVTNPNGDQSNAVSFTVVTPLSITSLSPAALPVAAGDSTLIIAGAGIVSGATVQFGAASLPSNSGGSSTQLSVQIPGSLLTQAGQVSVTVTNPDGTVSNALTFTIVPLPSINVSATITPAGTNQVILTLDNPAPSDLTGTLMLTFATNSANTPANYVDPAMQFAAGGTSITFTIAKGAKTATLPGNGTFSPGSVAGTLTLTLTRLIAGIENVLPSPPPSKSFTIAAAAPTITPNTVRIINGTSTGFTVEVIGFTTTREVKSITLTFTSSQSIDGGGSFTVDLTSAFNAYFSSATGLTNGGTFKLDIPFTISGADASVVTAVSVTLTNSAGTSQSASGGR